MEYQSYAFSIQSLHLENFRGFDKLDIEFNPSMTVLTAPNGGGKSAILDALSYACQFFLSQTCFESIVYPSLLSLIIDNHRLIKQAGGGMTYHPGQSIMKCSGSVGYERDFPCLEWGFSGTKTDEKGKISITHQKLLDDACRSLLEVSADYDANQSRPYPLAPLIVAYGTQRLARNAKLPKIKTRLDRYEGYLGCLTIGASISVFRDWFRSVSLSALNEKLKLFEQGQSDYSGVQEVKFLSLVRGALNKALEDVQWRDAEWNDRWKDIVMTHPEQGILPYHMLSDGIQNIFNLVADMAHRAVRLNPCADVDLFDHLTGLVLIDEVDMYLHPSWQQKILSTLRKIFPKVQFVISTHSPQVLSTLKRDEIRIISQDDEGHWHADMPDVNPYAKEAGVALAGIFNTPTVPEVEESGLIAEVEQLYRDGKTAEADAKLEELKQKGVDISESSIRFWKFLAGK